MTDDYDTRLRFRLYIDGRLSAEQWINVDDPDCMSHYEAIEQTFHTASSLADLAGAVWCVEHYDPAKPPAEAYTRIGSDTGMMRDPLPVGSAYADRETRRRLGLL